MSLLEPELTELMEHIVSIMSQGGYKLSEKAFEAILSALRMSRERNVFVFGESFLYGILNSRSIAIAVFENLDINPLSLERDALQSFDEFDSLDEWGSLKKEDLSNNLSVGGYFSEFVASAQSDSRKTVYSSDILRGLITYSEQITERDGPNYATVCYQLVTDYALSSKDVKRELRKLKRFEPFAERLQYWVSWNGHQLCIQPFSFFNAYDIHGDDERDQGELFAAKLNTIYDLPFITSEEIEELNWLINRPEISEKDLQAFFEQHPRFLLGTEYKNLHSQLVLTRESGEKLIPDFFLEKVGSDFCDIIDLKTPNARLIVGPRNRRGFSRNLTLALNQVREYRNYFDNPHNRKEFNRRYGLQAFRPTISVIIGRSRNFFSEIERATIEDEYKNLRVITYDDIIERAKQQAVFL